MNRTLEVNTHATWAKNMANNHPLERIRRNECAGDTILMQNGQQTWTHSHKKDRLNYNNQHELPPAGYSRRLGNNLHPKQYLATLNEPCWDAQGFHRIEKPPPKNRVPEKREWQPAERKMCAPKVAGDAPVPPYRRIHETAVGAFIGGKKLCPEAITMKSNVDRAVFNQDIDLSEGVACMLSNPSFKGAAGFSKWSTTPACGYEMPNQTWCMGPDGYDARNLDTPRPSKNSF